MSGMLLLTIQKYTLDLSSKRLSKRKGNVHYIYVKNLSKSVTDEELNTMFQELIVWSLAMVRFLKENLKVLSYWGPRRKEVWGEGVVCY